MPTRYGARLRSTTACTGLLRVMPKPMPVCPVSAVTSTTMYSRASKRIFAHDDRAGEGHHAGGGGDGGGSSSREGRGQSGHASGSSRARPRGPRWAPRSPAAPRARRPARAGRGACRAATRNRAQPRLPLRGHPRAEPQAPRPNQEQLARAGVAVRDAAEAGRPAEQHGADAVIAHERQAPGPGPGQPSARQDRPADGRWRQRPGRRAWGLLGVARRVGPWPGSASP